MPQKIRGCIALWRSKYLMYHGFNISPSKHSLSWGDAQFIVTRTVVWFIFFLLWFWLKPKKWTKWLPLSICFLSILHWTQSDQSTEEWLHCRSFYATLRKTASLKNNFHWPVFYSDTWSSHIQVHWIPLALWEACLQELLFYWLSFLKWKIMKRCYSMHW